jgi:hypothetical protein
LIFIVFPTASFQKSFVVYKVLGVIFLVVQTGEVSQSLPELPKIGQLEIGFIDRF